MDPPVTYGFTLSVARMYFYFCASSPFYVDLLYPPTHCHVLLTDLGDHEMEPGVNLAITGESITHNTADATTAG